MEPWISRHGFADSRGCLDDQVSRPPWSFFGLSKNTTDGTRLVFIDKKKHVGCDFRRNAIFCEQILKVRHSWRKYENN